LSNSSTSSSALMVAMWAGLVLIFFHIIFNAKVDCEKVKELRACWRSDLHYLYLTETKCPETILSNEVARARFEEATHSVGWSFLEIETRKYASNEQQAYAAGVLEGKLTQSLILKHWKNTIAGYCYTAGPYCDALYAYLDENLKFMRRQIGLYPSDPFWVQVNLMLIQLAGLEDGYYGTITSPHVDIRPFGFLLFQLFGDLADLEAKLKRPEHLPKLRFGCSALIVPIPEKQELFFSHVTWTGYQTMLRIQKLYKFMYHLHRGYSVVPGYGISMSSYPGVLLSIDDFYITTAGIAVTETTFSNGNKSSYDFIDSKSTVLSWIRVMVANRLAHSAKHWTMIYSKLHSGTYTNQWMIVDYNNIPSDMKTFSYTDVLYVMEEIPGYFQVKDMTSVLYSQGYWPSYNIPYFPTIFNITGTADEVKLYGDWFTYDKHPRALIFKRDWHSVVDLESLLRLMRYNDFKKDPLSACNCTPPYSAENAISARNDLNDKNGIYPFKALGFRSHGGTDVKATNVEMALRLQFVAISGPTYDTQPPFQWSKTEWHNKLSHFGHPDLFVFPPVKHKWKFI
ncbi:putative phospholipase B-like 2, partial [Trichinella pseudospiralis]